jgi:hypothetical protein
MNIHEYQAKAVLKEFGAPVAEGVAIFSADEAEAAAKKLPGPLWVVKSQIHAGGRGKGKFKELSADAKGGVRLAFSLEEVVANAKEMLGNTWSPSRPARPASRSTVSTSRTAPTSSASFTSRSWSTAPSAARPSSSPPRAAWTSRRWPKRPPTRSSRCRSTRRPA